MTALGLYPSRTPNALHETCLTHQEQTANIRYAFRKRTRRYPLRNPHGPDALSDQPATGALDLPTAEKSRRTGFCVFGTIAAKLEIVVRRDQQRQRGLCLAGQRYPYSAGPGESRSGECASFGTSAGCGSSAGPLLSFSAIHWNVT